MDGYIKKIILSDHEKIKNTNSCLSLKTSNRGKATERKYFVKILCALCGIKKGDVLYKYI